MTLLDYYLSMGYRAMIIKDVPVERGKWMFTEALDADHGLRRAAQERLADITDDVAKRDFVSKVHRDWLLECLGEEPRG